MFLARAELRGNHPPPRIKTTLHAVSGGGDATSVNAAFAMNMAATFALRIFD